MLNDMFCPRCDEIIEDGWNFCPICGCSRDGSLHSSEYETLNADGRLIVLPCKPGEEVYVIQRCSCGSDYPKRDSCRRKTNVVNKFTPRSSHKLRKTSVCLYVSKTSFRKDLVFQFGTKVFLTKEDAEKAIRDNHP